MNKLILVLLLALASINASAQTQTFLDNLRKIEAGKGKVVVMQSPEIDRLVNGNPATETTTVENSRPAAPNRPAAETSKPVTPNRTHNGVAQGNDSDLDPDAAIVIDTRKKVMRNSYKTTGYRIQVYSGGNSRVARQEAERAGNAMKVHFPTEPIYVHFYSPSWKCRMGNYREMAEAQRILAQVKALGYKQACIVKGTISVAY